jgi:subtilase family serine protease
MLGLFGRSRRSFRLPIHGRPRLHVEELETRTLLSAFSPAQIAHAYGFDQVSFTNALGQAVRGDGTGQTIAIVDAYHDRYLSSDLKTFDNYFGIAAPPKFTVAYPQGVPTSQNSNWALEEAMDVEWAHAIAPRANILVVEVATNNMSDLFTGVNYARKQPGVSVVSMSWGSTEWSGQLNYEAYFKTPPAGHIGGSGLTGGVTFVASTGDSGAGVEYPSTSPHVLAVGGTTLQLDAAGNYQSETAWNLSGGGTSQYEPRPTYQIGFQTAAKRTNPDVSMISNWNAGVSIYNTMGGGWEMAGGTSLGAPIWAALIAIADQGRNLQGLGSLDGTSQTIPTIYQLPGSDFHDVTRGTNGYSAKAGYDLTTGRGSPYANRVIAGLVGAIGSAGSTTTTSTSTSTGTATTSARTHGFAQPIAAPGQVASVVVTPRVLANVATGVPSLAPTASVLAVAQQRLVIPSLPGLPAWTVPGRIESGSDARVAESSQAQGDVPQAPAVAPAAQPDTQDSTAPVAAELPASPPADEAFVRGKWDGLALDTGATAAAVGDSDMVPDRAAMAAAVALVLGGTWRVRTLQAEQDECGRRYL